MISVRSKQIRGLLVAMFAAMSCAHVRPQSPAASEQVAPPNSRIHFATAGSTISRRQGKAVNDNIAWLKHSPNVAILLEGHTDERGGEEYNLALGDRRARSVAAALLRGGVNPWQVVGVISRGELKPAVHGNNPRAWAANRRVEIMVR